MITVNFVSRAGRLCGFEISGHATRDENDETGKIVCAAVSSAALMTANTITEVLGEKCSAEAQDGYMKFLGAGLSESATALLDGFKLHICELKKEYGKRIKIITED